MESVTSPIASPSFAAHSPCIDLQTGGAWRDKRAERTDRGTAASTCAVNAVTQDAIQGYLLSPELVLSKASMTRTEMTPSVPLDQLRLLRSTQYLQASISAS